MMDIGIIMMFIMHYTSCIYVVHFIGTYCITVYNEGSYSAWCSLNYYPRLYLAIETGYHKFSLSLNHKLAIDPMRQIIIVWLSRKRRIATLNPVNSHTLWYWVYESRSFNLLVMSMDCNDCTMSCSEAAAVGRECNPESVHSQTLLSKFIALIAQ